jgi:hypothetical protein
MRSAVIPDAIIFSAAQIVKNFKRRRNIAREPCVFHTDGTEIQAMRSKTPGTAANQLQQPRCLEQLFAIEILRSENYFSVDTWADGRGGETVDCGIQHRIAGGSQT